MTAARTVLALTGAPGVFLTSTVFWPGAAAVRPPPASAHTLPGSRLAAGHDEQPAR